MTHYAILKHIKVFIYYGLNIDNLLHFDSLNIVNFSLFVIAYQFWAVTIISQPFRMSSYFLYEMQENNLKYAWYLLKN